MSSVSAIYQKIASCRGKPPSQRVTLTDNEKATLSAHIRAKRVENASEIANRQHNRTMYREIAKDIVKINQKKVAKPPAPKKAKPPAPKKAKSKKSTKK